jgi:acetyltransferase-like isoleucine patch superfamily enzyme
VVQPMASQVVAVGNPARVVKERSPQLEGNGVPK